MDEYELLIVDWGMMMVEYFDSVNVNQYFGGRVQFEVGEGEDNHERSSYQPIVPQVCTPPAPRSTTQHHAAPRSTTQHHAAPRSITQHHAAPRSTTQHHAAPRSITQHHTTTLSTTKTSTHPPSSISHSCFFLFPTLSSSF